MPESSAGQPLVAAPHDLVTGVGVVLGGAVSSETGDQGDGCTEIVRGSEPLPVGAAVEEEDLVVGEYQLRLTVGDLTSDAGDQYDAPSDDGIDGDGPLQAIGGPEGRRLNLAAGLEDAEKVLDAPSLQVVSDHFGGGLALLTPRVVSRRH